MSKPEWLAYHGDIAKQPDLRVWLGELFGSRTAAEWDTLLGPADCCFSVVTPLADIHISPQFQARGALGIGADGQPWMRSPIRVDGIQPPLGGVPGYGEHTEQIMTAMERDDEAEA